MSEQPGAAPLNNPRHEMVAKEVAIGSSRTAAFLKAYPHAAKWKDTATHVKAAQMFARQEVKDRVAFLQAMGADKAAFTLADHLNRLNDLSKAAQEAGEFTAAVKAEENRGKAAGFYPTKVELTGRGGGPIETKHARDLTDEELSAELARYGLESRIPSTRH